MRADVTSWADELDRGSTLPESHSARACPPKFRCVERVRGAVDVEPIRPIATRSLHEIYVRRIVGRRCVIKEEAAPDTDLDR